MTEPLVGNITIQPTPEDRKDAGVPEGDNTKPRADVSAIPGTGDYDYASVPDAFIDRLRKDKAISRIVGALGQGAVEGFGPEPLGFSAETEAAFGKLGIFHDTELGYGGPIRLLNEATMRPAAAGVDTVFRLVHAGVRGIAGLTVQAISEAFDDAPEPYAGKSDPMSGKTRAVNELDLAGNLALMLLGTAPYTPFLRVTRDHAGKIHEQHVGALPRPDDFKTAAEVVTNGNPSPAVTAKLERIWQERGIHPAEIVGDMENDPLLAQSILSRDPAAMPAGRSLTTADNSGGGSGKPPVEPPRVGGPGERPQLSGPISDLQAAQDKILKHLSIGQSDRTPGYSWSRFYTDWMDRLFPVNRVVKDTGQQLAAAEDPYKLMRLFAGWAGKAERMIHQEAFEFLTFKKNGPSLDEIMKPVVDDMNGFRAFIAAARAAELESRGIAHGFDLPSLKIVGQKGIKKYGPVMEKLVQYQNNLVDHLYEAGILSAEARAGMKDANRLFVPFHVVVDTAKVGIARVGQSMEARNPIHAIKGSEAIKIDPLETIIKNTYVLTAMADKNVAVTKLVDMLLAGEAGAKKGEIKNLPVVRENKLPAKEFLREAGVKSDPLAEVLEAWATPDKPGEVSIFRNGVRETYQIDPELANAVKNLDAQTMGLVEHLLRPLSKTLRAGAVLVPEFQARHTFRDFIYAFVTTKQGVFNPVDMMRGFSGMFIKDADYWNWKTGGGGNVSLVSLDRRFLQDDLAKLTGETGLFTRSWNVVIDPEASWLQKGGAVLGLPFKATSKFFIHPLQVVTELVTSASHLGAYKKTARRLENAKVAGDGKDIMLRDGMTLKDGLSRPLERGSPSRDLSKEEILEAAWVSRDTAVDAARIGAKMRSVNAIDAFANIAVQDTDRIARALKNNPVGTALKLGIGIAMPSVLLWTANHEDSRYKDIPDWEKNAAWIILTDRWEDATEEQAADREPDMIRISNGRLQQNNGVIYRLPKPFAAGVIFGSGPERLLDAWAEEQSPHAGKNYLIALAEAMGGHLLIPNAVSPMLDQANNETLFTGRTLIPGPLEKQLPEYQYTANTTETAKALGRLFSAFPGISEARLDKESPLLGGFARALSSPILIENYIRGWTGGLGHYALQIADYGLRKAGVVADPQKADSTLADVPVVRAFTIRYPSASTQSLEDFYKGYSQRKTIYDTWIAKAREGDENAMSRIEAIGGDEMFLQLDGIQQVLHEHSRLIQMLNENPDLSGSEKRQQIDSLYHAMMKMGREGAKLLKQTTDR